MLMEESFRRTKRFFQKRPRNIKSLVAGGCQKLLPLFSGSNIRSKFQELRNFCRSCSERWNLGEVVDKEGIQFTIKEQTEGNEHCGNNPRTASDHGGLEDLKEEKRASKHSGDKQEDSSFLAAESLAQKKKELEMMEGNDGDHVLDIEEVLHYYSHLTSPVYLEIVDKFFMDMYLEFHLPQPSRGLSNSMRKLGSANSSMRKLGSARVHGSMRKAGSGRVHSSMRKLDSGSVHSSMRKLGSVSVHSSMRKLSSGSIHSSERSLGPLKL